MSGDFGEIEALADALLRQLEPAGRRALLRKMARDLRGTQALRIAANRAADGSAFPARKPKRELKPGNHAVRFLYPKGAAEPRVVFMKSWVLDGPLMTGFDAEAGGIRSFFRDQVAKWLPVGVEEQNARAGKFRRRGSIRQKAMFRKLRSGRSLRADATDREAWIGFSGRAAEIARVHQEGSFDRPAAKARPVRYSVRQLLGLTEAERSRAVDMLLEHMGGVDAGR